MFSCQRKHFSITGLELSSKSQWQYIYTSPKNEAQTFFPAPSPHHSHQRITPQPGSTRATGVWHTCVHHPPPSNLRIQEQWVHTPGPGKAKPGKWPETRLSSRPGSEARRMFHLLKGEGRPTCPVLTQIPPPHPCFSVPLHRRD